MCITSPSWRSPNILLEKTVNVIPAKHSTSAQTLPESKFNNEAKVSFSDLETDAPHTLACYIHEKPALMKDEALKKFADDIIKICERMEAARKDTEAKLGVATGGRGSTCDVSQDEDSGEEV